MKKYIITEKQLSLLIDYQRINENFDSSKVKIENGILKYNNIPYKVYTAGKERKFEYFTFDGDTLKMKFTDGKAQEFSVDSFLLGGKIKEIMNGLINGLKEISLMGGKLLFKRLS